MSTGLQREKLFNQIELLRRIKPRADGSPGCEPQYDPKQAAKRRLSEAKAEAKAAVVRKETRGMKPLSSFFGKRAEAAQGGGAVAAKSSLLHPRLATPGVLADACI